jgi:hypothetical protein
MQVKDYLRERKNLSTVLNQMGINKITLQPKETFIYIVQINPKNLHSVDENQIKGTKVVYSHVKRKLISDSGI